MTDELTGDLVGKLETREEDIGWMTSLEGIIYRLQNYGWLRSGEYPFARMSPDFPHPYLYALLEGECVCNDFLKNMESLGLKIIDKIGNGPVFWNELIQLTLDHLKFNEKRVRYFVEQFGSIDSDMVKVASATWFLSLTFGEGILGWNNIKSVQN